MNRPENTTSIVAVVITFNPDLSVLRDQINRTVPQVKELIVVDNGSSNAESIKALVDQFEHTEWRGLGKNFGLGHAHNVGIRCALEDGAGAVLILDQDTLPEPDMVRVLSDGLAQLKTANPHVAAVGARFVGSQTEHQSFFVQFRRFRFKKCFCAGEQSGEIIPADVLISSGALFSVDALSQIGNMEEDLFIDHVDTEWFLRAHHQGWQSYGICDAVMRHSLGERTFRLWLGRWRYLPIHKPFRYYYIYRNSLLLYRRHYATGRWKQTDILRLLMMFVIFAVLAGNRYQNLKMMCRGLADGFRGKSGRLTSEH